MSIQYTTCCQEAIELSDGGALLLTTSRWAEEGFSGVPAAPRLTTAVLNHKDGRGQRRIAVQEQLLATVTAVIL